MTELIDWITELKTEKPELQDFIKKLEGFISDTGFDTAKFEKAVETGLQRREEEVRKKHITDDENKKDNN